MRTAFAWVSLRHSCSPRSSPLRSRTSGSDVYVSPASIHRALLQARRTRRSRGSRAQVRFCASRTTGPSSGRASTSARSAAVRLSRRSEFRSATIRPSSASTARRSTRRTVTGSRPGWRRSRRSFASRDGRRERPDANALDRAVQRPDRTNGSHASLDGRGHRQPDGDERVRRDGGSGRVAPGVRGLREGSVRAVDRRLPSVLPARRRSCGRSISRAPSTDRRDHPAHRGRGRVELHRCAPAGASFPVLRPTERVLDYVNVRVSIPANLLPALAAHPAVFGIEPLFRRRPPERRGAGPDRRRQPERGSHGPSAPGLPRLARRRRASSSRGSSRSPST